MAGFPDCPDDAEIIVKESFLVRGYTEPPIAIPDIRVLANPSGFRYLSELFAYFAEKNVKTQPDGPDPDPDVHFHLQSDCCDGGLSDLLEFRIGHLSPNREETLRHYAIRPDTRATGCLTKRYRRLIAAARKHLPET